MSEKTITTREPEKEASKLKGSAKLERVTRSWKEHLAITVMETSSFSKNLEWRVEGEKIYYKQKTNTALEKEDN